MWEQSETALVHTFVFRQQTRFLHHTHVTCMYGAVFGEFRDVHVETQDVCLHVRMIFFFLQTPNIDFIQRVYFVSMATLSSQFRLFSV